MKKIRAFLLVALGYALTSTPSLGVPAIFSFDPVSAATGAVVTITGTNFNPIASNNVVFFGAVKSPVISASLTNLSVGVPVGATFAPITVTSDGLVAYSPEPFQPTFFGDGSNITASSFAPRVDLAGGDGPHLSVISDLDGDGKPDVAVVNVYGHTISLFRNIGSPGSISNNSFAAPVDLPAEGGGLDNPYGFTAADVDGDGKPDLIACDRLGNRVSVYRNLATPGDLTVGSFAPHVNINVGNDPRFPRIVDLDGDGRPDLVTCNYGSDTISILRNIGVAGSLDTNSVAARVDLPVGSGPYGLAAGDLDGDGKPDLAVINANSTTLTLYRNVSSPGILDTNSFATRVDIPALSGNATIALGDLDGDGRSDLVTGSVGSMAMSVYLSQTTPGSLNTNSFAPQVDFWTGYWTHNVALGDMNGDAKPDIVAVGELPSVLSVFQNLSVPGTFTSSSLARVDFGTGWNAWGISVGDLDGDGQPEMVFCNAYDDTVSIYRNLTPAGNPPTNTPPVAKIIISPLDELPGVTNLVVIAGACCHPAVMLDASESSDAEDDPLTYVWMEGTNILGYEVTITNRFAPGTHEITLMVSDGMGVGTAVETFEVIRPEEAVRHLMQLVQESDLPRRTKVPLLAWLRTTAQSFHRCNSKVGVLLLKHFQRKVAVCVTPSYPELGAELTAGAQTIMDAALDCRPRCKHNHHGGKPKPKHGHGHDKDKDHGGRDKDHKDRDGKDDHDKQRSDVKASRSSAKSK